MLAGRLSPSLMFWTPLSPIQLADGECRVKIGRSLTIDKMCEHIQHQPMQVAAPTKLEELLKKRRWEEATKSL